MKKTLTVNLGGTVYNIDEDAYILLDNYLSNMKYHFRNEDGSDEIIRDMEIRIAELFTEYINRGSQVITIENVEEVIERMGRPEQLDPESVNPESFHSNDQYSNTSSQRRLFRNPDDKILGGVLSGVSAFLGWDATLVRIIFILLGFFLHWFVLAYLIAWIIIPVAKTATEKLQMKGEPVNMENIGKTVRGGFERINEYNKTEKPSSFIAKVGSSFISIFGLILKVVLVLAAICCAPFVLIALIVLFALLMAGTGIIVQMPSILYDIIPNINWSIVGASSGMAITMVLCGILIVGIPVIGLIQLIQQAVSNKQSVSTTVKIVMVLLWVLALVLFSILAVQAPFIVHSNYFLL